VQSRRPFRAFGFFMVPRECIITMEWGSIAVMEYLGNSRLARWGGWFTNTPLLQHSITPEFE